MAENNVARQHFTLDAELILAEESTTAGTTPVVGQVSAADRFINVGGGRINGHLIIDVSAADITTSDEMYRFELRGSSSSTHASTIVTLATLELGDNTQLSGDQDLTVNRYVVPFSNVLGDAAYEYLQIRLVPTGTTPSITWFAWLNKNPF